MLKIFLVALVAQSSYSSVISRQDDVVFVDDMVLTREQYNELTTRKLLSNSKYFWTKTAEGVIEIPYFIESPNVNHDDVAKGHAHWEENTCVKFTKFTAEPEGKAFFKYIQKDPKKCYAYLGMSEGKATSINLGNGCGHISVVIHEVGHAIGFFHEQSRADRDKYLTVFKENIDNYSQYGIKDTNSYGVPYDYMSIMHYSASVNKEGKISMLATDPRFQVWMGSAKGLSFMDKLMFNKAYKCIDDWLKICKLTDDPCKNLGYTGKDCKCVCPDGTSGDNCENVDMEYNDALMKKLSPLTQMFTTENSIVSSPNYPKPPIYRFKYRQFIKAPKCKRAVLTFEDFQIFSCTYEHLTIRKDILDVKGTKFCEKQITKGQVFKSEKSLLILDFYGTDFSGWGYNPNPGYKAIATFEPIEGCTA